MKHAPIVDHDPTEASVFQPDNLLEGARRQKCLPRTLVPSICLLDMDGELVERLYVERRAIPDRSWPCFHTRLYRWQLGDQEVGVVGGTVGAPFAVLVAEELLASGCEALVTISSAGLVAPDARPPFFVLVDRALRDEGTSYHYQPPARWAEAAPKLLAEVAGGLAGTAAKVLRGPSWTTDAPFRESAELIASRQSEGILCVEMEAAALLAMGQAIGRPVVCLAHVTNAMATRSDDFEKGGHDGQQEALDVCSAAIRAVAKHLRAGHPAREGHQP